MTESVSTTNTPPAISSTSSCFASTATAPSAPPIDNAPTSPMIIEAGYAVNHRNPSDAATSAAHDLEHVIGEPDASEGYCDEYRNPYVRIADVREQERCYDR